MRTLNERLGHMNGSDDPRSARVRFVAEPNDAIVNFPDGRRFQDVDVVVLPEHKNEMRAGYRCLRCHERHEYAFPSTCEVCGYPMKERQIMDIAMEFEGERHLGPRKPMSEYIQEQEERALKREFEEKIASGASPMKGLR